MENRTPDLRVANATLYQLSYDPTKVGFCVACGLPCVERKGAQRLTR